MLNKPWVCFLLMALMGVAFFGTMFCVGPKMENYGKTHDVAGELFKVVVRK